MAAHKANAKALDFSALAVEDAEAPTVTRGSTRKSAAEGTPVLDWVRDSFENKRGKSVVVPENAVENLVSLIKSAARFHKVSTRIATEAAGRGKVRVTFVAVPTGKRRTKAEMAAAKAEAAAKQSA